MRFTLRWPMRNGTDGLPPTWFFLSFYSSWAWPSSFPLRGADLTKLMVTLGIALVLHEIANQAGWLTGGADGLQGITVNPIFGLFEFDLFGTTAYAYSLAFGIANHAIVAVARLSLDSVERYHGLIAARRPHH